MLYLLLQAFAVALLPMVLLWLLWLHRGRWEEVGARLGFYEGKLRAKLRDKSHPRCWIHAASIGEAKLALKLIDSLRRCQRGLEFVVSTMTEEGRLILEQRRPENVEVVFFPLDFIWCMRRAYRLIRPDLVVLVEMEYWPNHLWLADELNVPVCVINARMPEADFRKYRRFAWFFRSVFSIPQLVCAPSTEDAEQLVTLGVTRDRIVVTGNLKYDLASASLVERSADSSGAVALLRNLGVAEHTSILVAGSTWVGEEKMLIDVVAEIEEQLRPFLVIAPRDVVRSSRVASLARERGMEVLLRSEIDSAGIANVADRGRLDALVLDKMGELTEFYAAATVCFVGRSLAGRGGHNPLEPLAAGSPVIFGPNMQNFEAIAEGLVLAGAGVQIQSPAELSDAVVRLLQNPGERKRIVHAAQGMIWANAGSMERTVQAILAAIPNLSESALANCALRTL